MFKKVAALSLIFAILALFAACGAAPKNNGGKLTVLVSFDAMYELVSAVGRERVSVTAIVPSGMETHDFEPKAQDIAALSTAGVFVYNGFDMEPWAKDAVLSANNDSLVVAEASWGVDPITLENGGKDPHVWLSLKAVEIEVSNILNALCEADPDNAAFYKENADEYTLELEALYTEYAAKFETLTRKDFVTGHAAFGYLCREFGLTQISVSDVFAEGEPNARRLGELVEFCKANNITTIFSEELASPEVSQTLANEVGAEVKAIYTMENAEDGLTYLERMEKNLAEIYESMAG